MYGHLQRGGHDAMGLHRPWLAFYSGAVSVSHHAVVGGVAWLGCSSRC